MKCQEDLRVMRREVHEIHHAMFVSTEGNKPSVVTRLALLEKVSNTAERFVFRAIVGAVVPVVLSVLAALLAVFKFRPSS